MVDPITQEVVRHRLGAIADEMEMTLLRAAYSSIVKEGLDASAAIFDRFGNNIAQAAAIPIHIGCMIPSVETVIRLFPCDTMQEGDVYVLNDPYNGGTHLPDISIIKPLFHQGRVVALAATMSHHQEIGGMVAGSLPPNATDLFQEGLQIPPMKLVDAGAPVQQVFDILERNVRTPHVVMGDLRAQLAACKLAGDRVSDLCEELGSDLVAEILESLLAQSDTLTRERIAAMPDGVYEFTDYMDDDGVNVDEAVRIKATVTVAGSELTVDFTGTQDQVRGPFNCVPASSISAVYYVLRAVTGNDIPNNSGCYRSVNIVLPEGSLVNPRRPAPVNSRTATVRRICDTLLGCFQQIVPKLVPAASCGQLLVMNFGGTDPATGEFYVTSELGVGGMGGRSGLDGVDAIETDATNCMNVPAETIELESPVRVLSWEITPDSGGAGTWRGGCGTRKTFQLMDGTATANYRGERHRSAPWGVDGGAEASRTWAQVVRHNGDRENLPSKTMVSLGAGDQLTVELSGGGGYGSPLLRDPHSVLRDVEDQRVSLNAASSEYGVVIIDGVVELDRTIELRNRLRTDIEIEGDY
ncbi:hydantoinase B/oxoprolinase family protein [[Mycobacterium] appelbergii]|uniref:hydantoinase B/oxoprolinase family protein n=1 Tax=[Mycobacterium] appelbergii TaxID=2939269 RepID=UPI002938D2D8|nr:hydantoinase B/oxoprolinase family protein [Mycobacterium sp. 21AC1]